MSIWAMNMICPWCNVGQYSHTISRERIKPKTKATKQIRSVRVFACGSEVEIWFADGKSEAEWAKSCLSSDKNRNQGTSSNC